MKPLEIINDNNITDSDIERIKAWNDTSSAYENNICIHEKFEKQVEQNPDRIAIFWYELEITYREFNKHSNKLAHYLINKGAMPDTLIAICMDRSPEMMIGIYAILKAGAAYMPVDPNAPMERLEKILNDGKPLFILTSRASVANLPSGSEERIYLDNIIVEPYTEIETNPSTEVNSRNIAYVIYTSGSTGIPKGVMIEHHSVLNRIGWMQKAYPILSKDVLVQKTPVTFDVSVWELFWWGYTGASLVLLQPGAEKEPERIVQAINDFEISVIHFVPSMFGAFISYLDSFLVQHKIITLKKVFLSGEALPPSMVNEFNSLMGESSGTEVINLYGPTEATVDVSHYLCPKTFLDTMYIGKPIDNTKLLVINEKNQIQSIGVPGELVIAGVNLARGYLNRDELNREKFVEIKYFDGKPIKVYKTGDLVKWTESGDIFYIGRIDNQVKIRGFRIELGDIESQLSAHESVKSCAVIVNRSNSQNPQLVAYLCLKPYAEVASDEIKQYLLKKLPEYMVPSIVVFLEEMPLTSSGKIDRKALPEPSLPKKDYDSILSINNFEGILIKIWKDVLKVEEIGTKSNFFDIGGNSILIPFIVNKLNKEHGIKIKNMDIIQYPTIELLANNVLKQKKTIKSEDKQPLVETSFLKAKDFETILSNIWKEILKIKNISLTSNFFDIGGNSILIPFIINKLYKAHGIKINSIDIIQYPTIELLAQFINNKENSGSLSAFSKNQSVKVIKKEVTSIHDIAVIGMACRFPGARNLDEYWANLISGKDTIKHFTDDEISDFEFDFNNLKNNPDYVRAKGVLEDIDKFDAPFFGMTPKEAAETDPQHRIWLETVWDAFENSGCDPFTYKGSIGVFAGGYISTYLLNNILRDTKRLENYIRLRTTESYQILTANDPSFISTKTAYKFNLKGPAINVQTACSTSLVAIAQACQSLYNNESDICLAGGVCISVPQESGYLFQEGAIPSPDGCCRPFDAQAKGTVLSNGVGVVILKRMEDAIRDCDNIYARVKGWALNNDGSNKVSYTAPSIDGQAEVIMMAQSFADVSPEDISYIEAHGTATQLGDPVEVMALTKAFSGNTDKKQFCGIGSVKSNIGHTDAAAGVASFIKASLAAFHKKIPATLHFSEPNKDIDFENSPFYVLGELKEWTEDKPLIMGVSSFGIGGTNAHVIIEEPPLREKFYNTSSEWPALVLLSAKSENSLNRRIQDLVDFVKANSDLNIHDLAYTLETGRNHMSHRSFAVATNLKEIFSDGDVFTTGETDSLISKIAFMFPGQGAQYVSMGKDLYNSNKLFRQILDECFDIVKSETGEDIKTLLFESTNIEDADRKLASTEITQPVLFIIEYALAKIFEQFDIKPKYLIGHSIGEYTAACIAGVFDMKTALKVVIKRGQLMQRMQVGNMMAVRTSVDKLKSLGNSYFEIAADNAPALCTISFKSENTEKVKTMLDKNDIQYIPLNTSHAFHSAAFDPILYEFSEFVNQFSLNAPVLPFISCLTGEFITKEQATSGTYWAQQLRNTVLFRHGISTISKNDDVIYLEIGPNTHLSSLVRQNKDIENKKAIIDTLGKPENVDERYKILSALGNMFNIGININFNTLQKDINPNKISLPTYPFERKRHWIDFKLTQDIKKHSYSFKLLEDFFGIKNGQIDKEVSTLKNTDLATKGAHDLKIFTPTEQIIFNIWSEAFLIKDITIMDNFFEIGGDSLLAITVMSKIKSAFIIELSLKAFLDGPTIKNLAKVVDFNLKK